MYVVADDAERGWMASIDLTAPSLEDQRYPAGPERFRMTVPIPT